MPYAFVQDVAATWQDYERTAAQLIEPAPTGLILHVAGPTEEGVRVIDIWESEEAWRTFSELVASPKRSPAPLEVFRDLRPVHVVYGGSGQLLDESETRGCG